MLTSRNDECHQFATEKYIALDGLAEAEAQGLLLRAAHVPHDQHWALKDDAQKVASLLRSHPLALIQAGSYVARGHCTLAEYPQVYVQQRKRLLAFRPNQAWSRYRDVYTTFEASAEILQSSLTESSGDALQLLSVLAICGLSRLPLPLFEAAWRSAQTISPSKAGTDDTDRLTPWHASRLPSFIQIDIDIWDSFRLIEAIHLLKSFSLVSTDTYNGFLSVSMHPLIHAWARDRLDPTEQHGSWVTTGCLVVVSSDDHVLWRKHGRQLQPHLQALVSWEMSRMFTSEPPVMITCILVKCGWLLYNLRDDAKLFVLMNNLLTYLSLNRLTVDERWLPVYDLTARNLVNYGKVREAVSLLEQVVKIREQTLAEDHPDRLTSQHELAGAYRANGQVKEAVSLLEQVVKIQEQTLAEDHPSRLASQHALAIAYRANGQVKEAVSLLEQVVKIREQTLAEDHPSRLASQHGLAGAYEANGQVKEAVSLLEQVVKIQEQTLAEDHPDRLTSQHELARAYKANGQVKEAVSLLEQVVKIREQTLAEDHPDRLASQHELARAYRANRQVKEAVSLLEQVVKIQEQTLAEDHPSRLTSQHELAIIFWDLGRRNASLQIMKHVVEIRGQVLDKHHPDRKNSEAWLEYFEDEMCNVEPA
jgi:tetratricopeptide (TPR) repeat protein